MAYLIGPSEASRLVFTIVATNGSTKGLFKSKAGRPATYYVDPDPTAEPTQSMLTTPADIRKLDGTAYADSTVTIDAFSMLPTMRFPDGTPPPDSLLVTCDGGPPVRVYAREDDRLDALNTAVTALQPGGASEAATAAALAAEAASRATGDTNAIASAAADATTKANAAQAAAVQRANHTGTQSADTVVDGTTNKAYTAAEKTKLAGVATGATANSADATLLARANHTGTQSADTLTDGTTNKAFLATERTKLSGVATGATANSTDAQLRDRSTHTGAQAISTVTGLQTALDAKVVKDSLVVNVEDYAAGNANFLHTDGKWYTDSSVSTLATDDTAAIRALVTAGVRNLWFGSKRYRIKWTEQSAFLTWTSANGVSLRGNGAVLCDETSYTASPANPYTPVFLFDACTDVKVEGVQYLGPTITSPATTHGYVGATYVRAVNGCSGIKVDASVTNARYGVQSGSYPTAADGYNRGFDLNLRCSWVAYPQAHYLAEDVKARIYATDVHRASYLAGVKGARVDVQFKNQWIANIVCLVTDSLTGSGTSRGTSGLRLRVQDLGSDRTEATCILAGIALQRCDPDTVFADLDFEVYSESSDTVSQNVTAFQIVSGVHTLFPGTYAYNWIPQIYLKNIRLSGLLDKSKQTVAHATGTVYIQTNDGAQAATVSNLQLDHLTIRPSSGEASFDYLYVPGLVDRATISHCVMDNFSFTIIGNTTYPVVVTNSTLGNVTSSTRTHWVNSRARSLSDTSWANATAVNSDFNGAGARLRSKQVELTLSGASTTWASAIPAAVVVLGLTGVISQTVTGATGLQIGVAGDPARYLNTNSTAAGFQFTPAQQAATEQTIWWSPGGSTSIVVTAKGSNFTGGKVRLFLSYIDFAAPAS